MLTRTVVYEGHILPGREQEFFRRVSEELEPLWRRFRWHDKPWRPHRLARARQMISKTLLF